MSQQTTGAGPVLAIVSHPVKDYATWRVAFDAHGPARAKAGAKSVEVFHDPKDANKVVISLRFPSLEALEGFMADPSLKDAMEKGGVTAPPTAIVAVAA